MGKYGRYRYGTYLFWSQNQPPRPQYDILFASLTTITQNVR